MAHGGSSRAKTGLVGSTAVAALTALTMLVISAGTAQALTGTPPQVTVGAYREFGVVSIDFDIGRPSCDDTSRAVGELRITVRGEGGRTTLLAEDACGDVALHPPGRGPNHSAFAKNWKLYGSYGEGQFFPDYWARSSGSHKLRYEVTLAGEELVGGRIRVKVRQNPSQRIYEGSDAFVNYCINEGVTIRSSGGRLYCVKGGGVVQNPKTRTEVSPGLT